MTGTRGRLPRALAWVVALTALLLVPAVPAAAHEHPTPTERAAPGVVWVEARAEVEVSLVEHLTSDPAGIHIRIIQSTSTPVLGTASAFVVDRTGAVVTDGSITEIDRDRAAIYAINEAFQERYGNQATMSGDLFTEQRIGDDSDRLQQRLDACYPPHVTNDAGGCVVRVTPAYVVHPHVTSQRDFGQLPAELLRGSTPEVAVLQVKGATSMPTVDLGESTAGARALAVLGFTGVPDPAEPVPAVNAHLAEVGGTVHQTQDMTEQEREAAVALAKALPAGLHGGPAVAEQGQVVGFFVPEAGSGPPPAAPGRLVDAGTIREVLSDAGITPRRGPVDSSFEAAMHAYKNGGYAAAIPSLKTTLDLFPGHAMATLSLTDSEQQVAAGTPGPAAPGQGGAAGDTGSGTSWLLVLAVVLAVLVLAVVAALVVRRRRAAAPAGGTAGPPSPVRPGEAPAAAPVRMPSGLHERRPVPTGAGGPGPAPGAPPRSGGVAVMDRGGPAPAGQAPSPSRHSGPSPSRTFATPPGAAGERDRGASRVFSGPLPSPRRDAPPGPAAEERPTFCTTCGARLAPHHRFCGRCGGATG